MRGASYGWAPGYGRGNTGTLSSSHLPTPDHSDLRAKFEASFIKCIYIMVLFISWFFISWHISVRVQVPTGQSVTQSLSTCAGKSTMGSNARFWDHALDFIMPYCL